MAAKALKGGISGSLYTKQNPNKLLNTTNPTFKLESINSLADKWVQKQKYTTNMSIKDKKI